MTADWISETRSIFGRGLGERGGAGIRAAEEHAVGRRRGVGELPGVHLRERKVEAVAGPLQHVLRLQLDLEAVGPRDAEGVGSYYYYYYYYYYS